MQIFTTLAVSVTLFVVGTRSHKPKFLKEPFDQSLFTIGHTWWVDSFSAALYGDADKCAHFKIKKDGDTLNMLAQFMDSQDKVMDSAMAIKSDVTHPARFFIDAGDSLVFEMGVVDTDYNNWSIVWAKIADTEAYHVLSTKQDISPFGAQINAVLAKLEIDPASMKRVNNQNCKDSLPA